MEILEEEPNVNRELVKEEVKKEMKEDRKEVDVDEEIVNNSEEWDEIFRQLGLFDFSKIIGKDIEFKIMDKDKKEVSVVLTEKSVK